MESKKNYRKNMETKLSLPSKKNYTIHIAISLFGAF